MGSTYIPSNRLDVNKVKKWDSIVPKLKVRELRGKRWIMVIVLKKGIHSSVVEWISERKRYRKTIVGRLYQWSWWPVRHNQLLRFASRWEKFAVFQTRQMPIPVRKFPSKGIPSKEC